MRRFPRIAPLAALAIAGSVGVSLAGAQPDPHAQNRCLDSRQWQGWKATPDSKVIYIRVGVNGVWRLDLQQACPELQMIDARLVTHNRGGSPFICSPLDMDLTIVDPPGIRAPCIVSKMTQLPAAEAKALPKALQP